MPCFTPLNAYRVRTGELEYNITFDPNSTGIVHKLALPCGSCIGCKKDRARDWSIRCINESKMYDSNIFLTLTYDDKNLPKYGSLNHRDFQLFIKKLRKKLGYSDENRIKYFMCGEYGEKLKRPHYHACIFNYAPSDSEYIGKSQSGEKLYESKTIQKLWDKGYSNFGEVTIASASYVAGYVDKKINGQEKSNHYNNLSPEYTTCSNGIGKAWIKRYYSDVYPNDQVVLKGSKGLLKLKPPRYYDKLYEKIDPEGMDYVKRKREDSAFLRSDHIDNTKERLITRYEVALKNKSKFNRNLGEKNIDHSIESNYSQDSRKLNFLKDYYRKEVL